MLACTHTKQPPQVGWFDDTTGQWDGTSLETVEGQRLARIMQDSWQLYPKPYVNCPLVEKLLVPLQKVSLLDTTADASTHTTACLRADSSSNPQQTYTGCAGKAAAWYTSAPAQLLSSTVAGLDRVLSLAPNRPPTPTPTTLNPTRNNPTKPLPLNLMNVLPLRPMHTTENRPAGAGTLPKRPRWLPRHLRQQQASTRRQQHW